MKWNEMKWKNEMKFKKWNEMKNEMNLKMKWKNEMKFYRALALAFIY